jgi:acyl carrier protein
MADMTDTASVQTTVLQTLSDVLNEPAGTLLTRPVLATYDWDSLASLEVLAQLESRLDVTLDLRSYHAARTIDDLVDLVAAAVVSKAVIGGR